MQNQPPEVDIVLQKVGVTGVRKRITFQRKEPYQLFIELSLFIKLPRYFKGANMSRFLEVLDEGKDSITSLEQYTRLVALRCMDKHKSEAIVEAKSEFPYTLKRPSGELEERVFPIVCSYDTERDLINLTIIGDGMSLCPCSKEMVNIGHTQRVRIEVTLTYSSFTGIELIKAGRIIDCINNSASSPVYSTLKRKEEGEMLKQAFEKPRFAEDIVRSLIVELRNYKEILRCNCKIKVISYESIHSHQVMVEFEGIL